MRSLSPRTGVVAALTGALCVAGSLVAGTGAALGAPAARAAACEVDYTVNDWGTGFTAAVTITNRGSALSGWTLTYSYTGDQHLANGWNGRWSQSGKTVTVKNPAWATALGTNASATPGFQGTYSGTNQAPSRFTLNGVVCDGSTGGGDPTDPPTDPTDPPSGDRVENPYAGVKQYVNPEWSAKAAAEPGGGAVADEPTGVWLDRIAAIEGVNGGMGLRDHLDEALSRAPVWSTSWSTTCPAATARRSRPTASSARPRSTSTRRSSSTRSRRSSATRSTPTCGSPRWWRSTRCRTWSPTPATGRPPPRTATS